MAGEHMEVVPFQAKTFLRCGMMSHVGSVITCFVPPKLSLNEKITGAISCEDVTAKVSLLAFFFYVCLFHAVLVYHTDSKQKLI